MGIQDKKGSENMVANHLLRLEIPDTVENLKLHIDDTFPSEHILALSHVEMSPWFVDIANYLSTGIIPPNLTFQKNKRFFTEVKCYF